MAKKDHVLQLPAPLFTCCVLPQLISYASASWFVTLGVLGLFACAEQHEPPNLQNQDIRLTILHTSDIHARLLPYRAQMGASDNDMGLLQDNEPFGGVARMAHIIQRERGRADRVVYVDSGDCFQGAPIFNAFHGEVELRALSYLKPDAVVVGNHEFDEGLKNYAKQLQDWSSFPTIAANYLFEPTNPLRDLVKPFAISNVNGLRIGFIGIANFSSLSSITEVGTGLEIIPLDIVETVQEWIDVLRPQVDLLVGVSHAGLGEDERIIQRTEGLDLMMGGHLHIVLNPPKVIIDKAGREVVLAHGGAFAKYVAKLDVVIRNGEVINHKFEVFPIDSTVPEDPLMLDLLEPYRLKLNQMIDLTTVYGYASKHIRRFDFDGGDSPLGNLVAEAIRKHAWADIGITNSLGIRTDIFPGPITLDDLYNIFPFNNTITTLYMSGFDIQALLDYTTRRSAGRGCATQMQVSGIEYTMNCTFAENEEECGDNCPPRAENIFLTNCGDPSIIDKSLCTKTPLNPYQIYEVATNDYIAHGGSGFTVLKINNTQVNTDVPLRDAVLEEIVRSEQCLEECRQPDGSFLLGNCEAYAGCVEALINYEGQFCEHISETAPNQVSVPVNCGMDEGHCENAGDCYRLEATCANGGCPACTTSAQCAANEECFNGVCVSPSYTCIASRCYRRCKADAGCYADTLVPDEQRTCIEQTPGSGDGYCMPSAGRLCYDVRECMDSALLCLGSLKGCTKNADCLLTDADSVCENGRCLPKRTLCTNNDDCEGSDVCVNGWCSPDAKVGTCGPCQVDQHCPADHVCAQGRCVVPTAVCEDQRCRPRCTNTSQCLANTVCDDGVCRPAPCLFGVEREEACLLENIGKAQKKCLSLPCPRAESDGRIKRLLPPNLDQLPTDVDPDDPEG